MSRIEQFTTYFQTWRGQDTAALENNYIKTALLIETHVNQPNSKQQIEQIKSDPSVWASFIQFSYSNPIVLRKPAGKSLFATAFGTLLYALLSLEDYLRSNHLEPSEEQALIQTMITSLKNLYTDYQQNPSEQLHRFNMACEQWLKLNQPFSLSKQQLTLSLYATLTIADHAINNIVHLPTLTQAFIRRLININRIQRSLNDLIQLARTAVESNHLPRIIITPPDDDQPVLQTIEDLNISEQPHIPAEEEEEEIFHDCSLPLNSIDEHYEKQAIILLANTALPLPERINQIKISFNHALSSIRDLATLKHHKVTLENELAKIQKNLLDEATSQEASRRAPVHFFNGLQSVRSYIHNTFQSYAPEKLQRYVGSFHRENPLSCSLQRLQELTGTMSENGVIRSGEIQDIENQIKIIIESLTDDTFQLKQLFNKATSEHLNQLSTKLSDCTDLMDTITNLVNTIRENQAMNANARRIATSTNAFILQQDGIFVTLSLFLARWISIYFKTDTAAKIETAKTMSHELITIQQNYQTYINDNITIIHLAAIPSPIKETIVNELKTQTTNQMTEETIISPITLAQFNSIYTLFTPLKIHHDEMIRNSAHNHIAHQQ